MLAGLAGGVYAHFKQYIAPVGFDFNKSIEIVVMVILGGMGNNVGVIVIPPASIAISGSTGGAGVGSTDPWANFSY